MKKIENFLNSEKTFNKVLEILSKHGDLSKVNEKGFIAGGSVANTLIHIFDGSRLVINDIDVYYEVEKDKESKNTDWYSGLYVEDTLNILNNGYGNFYVSEDGCRFRITKHSRDGIFNNIGFIVEPNNRKKSDSLSFLEIRKLIIDGFDLNCCQAALDLENKKIVYNQNFVDFLSKKQLKVVNPNTPIQTVIRLFKKIEDLNPFCDVEHEIRFLTVAAKQLGCYHVCKVVGDETFIKFQKYMDKVSKYFNLRRIKETDDIPHVIKEKADKLWTYDALMNFGTTESFYSVTDLKRIWQLLYTYKKKSDQDKINKIYYKNVFLDNPKEDTWYAEHKGDGIFNENHPHFIYYYTSRITASLLLTNKNYYKCDFDLTHVDSIDKFSFQHPVLNEILKYSKNLTEHYKIIKFIKSLAKKEGDWVIGSLENIDKKLFKSEFEKENFKLTKNLISNLIELDKKISCQKLTEKLNLDNFEYKDCVNELVTVMDLRIEGIKMGHCVGGYSGSISSNRSRIFHVDCDGIGSTVQIDLPIKEFYNYSKSCYQKPTSIEKVGDSRIRLTFEDGSTQLDFLKNLKYRVVQHYGRYPEKGNLIPTDLNKNIVDKLIDFINEKYCDINFANNEKECIFV